MTGVAVLVSTRIDPVSGRATRSAADAAAVQLALQLDPGALVLTAGDMSERVAREYLALGAVRIECVGDAAALVLRASDATLILAGARSEGGIGSGLTPYQIANGIGCPLVPDVIDIQADASGWLLTQALARGARRRLHAGGAVIAVLSARASAATRYSYDAAQRGRIERSAPPSTAAEPTPWCFEPAQRQLRPLAARSRQSGFARMTGAVGGVKTAAGIVVKDGSIDDRARALLDHLRALGLLPA